MSSAFRAISQMLRRLSQNDNRTTRKNGGKWGQIKIYKQALSLHLIATSLIAVRAYQASATAIFDYSS